MDHDGNDHWLYRFDLCFRDQSVCLGGIEIMTKKSCYDITTFGEILIDFTGRESMRKDRQYSHRTQAELPANVAVAAAKLGARTAFLGKAGKDMHGEFLKEVLKKENVETDGMILDEKFFTTLAFVKTAENGERSFSFARKPGADTRIEKEEIHTVILDQTKIFHAGSLSLTDQPARDTTFYAVKRAKKNGSMISYDPNYRASLWKNEETAKEQMRSLIPYVDIMKISDEETELLTGKENQRKQQKFYFRKVLKSLPSRLEAKEHIFTAKKAGYRSRALQAGRIDTNGAGDSFWGGFLYCISKAGKVRRCLA